MSCKLHTYLHRSAMNCHVKESQPSRDFHEGRLRRERVHPRASSMLTRCIAVSFYDNFATFFSPTTSPIKALSARVNRKVRMTFDKKTDGGEMEWRASNRWFNSRYNSICTRTISLPEISTDYLQSKLDVMRDLS